MAGDQVHAPSSPLDGDDGPVNVERPQVSEYYVLLWTCYVCAVFYSYIMIFLMVFYMDVFLLYPAVVCF